MTTGFIFVILFGFQSGLIYALQQHPNKTIYALQQHPNKTIYALQQRPNKTTRPYTGRRSLSEDASNISPYIVGGVETTIEEHPYQVYILLRISPSTLSSCGGTIISQSVVLTAAHCVYQRKPEDVLVFAGFTSKEKKPEPISVQDVRTHSLYRVYAEQTDFDIGAIAIKGTFRFGRKVQPMRLPPPDYELVPGTLITTTGWGRTKENVKELPDILHEVSVPIVAWNICRDLYINKHGQVPGLDRNSFCAADLDGRGRDACQGDSGSGAIQNGYIVGIVSWGFGCGSRKSPGVYTNVKNFRKWITAILAYYDHSDNEGFKHKRYFII